MLRKWQRPMRRRKKPSTRHNSPLIFDTHAHLQDEAFDDDRLALFHQLADQGVGAVVLPGSTLADSLKAVEWSEKSRQMTRKEAPLLMAAVGVHPEETDSWNESTIEDLRQCAASSPCVVAIGEIGLDYHYCRETQEIQKRIFREQLELAEELQLPVVIHEREAFEDAYQLIWQAKKDGLLSKPAVFHCFSGSVESARLLMDLSFYLGFDGPLTFKKARKPLEVLQSIPRDRFLLETDSPYMAPEPVRGTRNHPGNVLWIARKAAEVLGLEEAQILEQNWENACRFFNVNLERTKSRE